MIYIILGTTAEYLKMFPIMKLFEQNKIDYKLIYTGQHGNLIEKDTERLKLRMPDIYLTSKDAKNVDIKSFIFWIPKVLLNSRQLRINKDDFVIVHGDAVSTLLGLIIGKLHRVKVAHVESGKRTFKLLNPFPEEITRIIVSRFADVCFPTSESEAKNIGRKKNVYITNGNTVFDSVRTILRLQPSTNLKKIIKKEYVLFLIHRQENILLKKNLETIVEILEMILKTKLKVIWPMHFTTNYELKAKGLWQKILDLQNQYVLEISPPFNYIDFIHAIKYSNFVASDAGGIQDESYLLNKPMLILRQATENLGIGETAYLSYLDKKRVAYFLNNYDKLKRQTKINGSPSKIIVKFFINNLRRAK